MKYLQEHPQITLVYHITYEGEEFTVTIPGARVVADPEISWYGPLWLREHFSDGAAGRATAANGSYIVRSGDTLAGIAKMFGTTVDTLVGKNNIQNKDLIYPGQVIRY
jgi:nucleoid-associated protein YgaU